MLTTTTKIISKNEPGPLGLHAWLGFLSNFCGLMRKQRVSALLKLKKNGNETRWFDTIYRTRCVNRDALLHWSHKCQYIACLCHLLKSHCRRICAVWFMIVVEDTHQTRHFTLISELVRSSIVCIFAGVYNCKKPDFIKPTVVRFILLIDIYWSV